MAFSPFRASDARRRPKRPPRPPQDGPRGLQESPKTAQEDPTVAQDGLKTVPDLQRPPQEVLEGPRTSSPGTWTSINSMSPNLPCIFPALPHSALLRESQYFRRQIAPEVRGSYWRPRVAAPWGLRLGPELDLSVFRRFVFAIFPEQFICGSFFVYVFCRN